MAEPLAIAIAVVRHQGNVLIGLRPPGVPLAGLWEFPGGKILPGETPEQAAVRECREETGLEIRLTGAYAPWEYAYPHGTMRFHAFAAEPAQTDVPPRPPFCWVPCGNLSRYAFPPANAGLVGQLMRQECFPFVPPKAPERAPPCPGR